MAAINAITADKLIRLIGTRPCPPIVDVRSDRAFKSKPEQWAVRGDLHHAIRAGALDRKDVLALPLGRR